MAIDRYQYCPCGSGSKIKFCCCKDLIPELDKVMRLLQSDQRAAARDQLQRLIEEEGPRSALLGIKCELELHANEWEAAEKTLRQLQEQQPHNPNVHALDALHAVHEGDLHGAVEKLQQAIEYSDQVLPASLLATTEAVARLLMVNQEFEGAHAHLTLRAGIGGDQDGQAGVLEYLRSEQILLVFKGDVDFSDCRDDVPWQGEFNAAMRSARRAAWLAACESLLALNEKVPDEPRILNGIATLYGCLGQSKKAIPYLRTLAQLESLPLEDRVLAETKAQTRDLWIAQDPIDQVSVPFAVSDTERLLEVLLSNPKAAQFPVESAEDDESPPPKGVFQWLSAPQLSDRTEVSKDELPRIVATCVLYGKRTDREAQLTVVLSKGDDFERILGEVAEACGEWLGERGTETVLTQVPRSEVVLGLNWLLPKSLPELSRDEVIREAFADAMLHRWPDIELPLFDGRTARDAVQDPRYHVPALGAILQLELSAERRGVIFDFNRVRSELGLPAREPFPLGDRSPNSVHPLSAHLIAADGLSDEGLRFLFLHSLMKCAFRAAVVFCREIMKRGQVEDLDWKAAFDELMQRTGVVPGIFELLDEARQQAEAEGAPGRMLFAETMFRLKIGHSARAMELVQLLQSRHMDEPGVAQALYQLLMAMGAIGPDGQPVLPEEDVAATPAKSAPGDDKKLWTPDSETGGQKSKLWVPGMD